MKRSRENSFSTKFRLLNFQEDGEEINWSSSELSELENEPEKDRYNNITNKISGRKRKRRKTLPKNVSNLDITITDVPHEHIEVSSAHKSPIFKVKAEKFVNITSPILNSPLYFPPYKVGKINSSPTIIKTDASLKSPIILQKHASPRQSYKSKKKLFTSETIINGGNLCKNNEKNSPVVTTINVDNLSKDNTGQTSPVLTTKTTKKKKSMINVSEKKYSVPLISQHNNEEKNTKNTKHIDDDLIIIDFNEEAIHTNSNLDNSMTLMKTNDRKFEKKVKAYFDSHFTSQSPSQISINETQTPTDMEPTSCDEIEMVSSLTQVTKSNANSFVSIKSELTSKNPSFTSNSSMGTDVNAAEHKKTKYKKNGLAFRLNTLLKKQKASVSLWQHERFLAESSNFVIPKSEHMDFLICKVNCKYGCYLLETMNGNDEKFFIVINSANVSNCSLRENAIFKLYEPYTILGNIGNKKLIVNTCKFECVPLM